MGMLAALLAGLGLGVWISQSKTRLSFSPRYSMSQDEAREVLGVSEAANQEEIQEAYRRLMQKNHPDQGGSAYLAAQINHARDVLTD